MPLRSSVRFGPFAFDAASGELTRDGQRVPLQRQPSRLLELLLAKPGDVVAREEIRLALWGEDTHVDFERSLNFCVAKLRAALGDSAAAPQFIETVPTRGYRFIATPTAPAAPATAAALAVAATSAAAATPAPPEGGRRWIAAAAALVVVAVVTLRVLSPDLAEPPKVVVVPFHNETGSPDLDRLAKGVSDATVVKLSATTGVRVIGNASGLTFSFRPRDMKAMGESLGAQYLVLGQMKRDTRRVRIVAHLIRVSDQTHVWANSYDTDTLDLPQQSAIAEEIAAAVALRIGKG